MQGEQPFCNLKRLIADLSNPDWTSLLIKKGFSRDIPTFWILEGLVYYIEQEAAAALLRKIADITAENSQIFVDIFHASRGVTIPYIQNVKDPFSKYFKWGLDIKAVPSFFASTGWNVTCSFADDHDQGRNVGQKGMIFIHGIRSITE